MYNGSLYFFAFIRTKLYPLKYSPLHISPSSTTTPFTHALVRTFTLRSVTLADECIANFRNQPHSEPNLQTMVAVAPLYTSQNWRTTRVPKHFKFRQAITSPPISRVPTEILCKFFTNFLSEDDSLPPQTCPRPLISLRCYSDPTILVQVCSHWRRVALNLPSLWSTIYICDPSKSHFYLTKLWLERAGGQPLNLSLAATQWRREDMDLHSAFAILSLFLSYSASWRSLDLRLRDVHMGTMQKLVQSALPCSNLESIKFNVRSSPTHKSGWESAYVDDIWSFFNSSPALRSVDLTTKFDGLVLGHTPFHQLKTINIHFAVSIPEAIALLRQFTAIENVTFGSLDVQTPLERHALNHSLVMEYLQILKIDTLLDLTPLFNQLSLPSLRVIDISQRLNEHYPQAGAAFAHLLSRSGCHLDTFNFRNLDIHEDDLKTYILTPALTWLRQLHLSVRLISTDTLALFVERNDTGGHSLMPHLEDLVFGQCRTSDGMLSDLIISRWHRSEEGRGGYLKTFRPWCDGGLGPVDLECMKKFADLGNSTFNSMCYC